MFALVSMHRVGGAVSTSGGALDLAMEGLVVGRDRWGCYARLRACPAETCRRGSGCNTVNDGRHTMDHVLLARRNGDQGVTSA